MHVFVTGATGFIGSALVSELIAAGHSVLGLTRSAEGEAALKAAGSAPHFGSLENLASLRKGAEAADAVIHLAFNHDFSRWAENAAVEKLAIEALGAELLGSRRPFIITSGTAVALTPGRATTENDPPNSPLPRVATEIATAPLVEQGVHVAMMRLPQVHNPYKQGLVTALIAIAREKGVSAYIGDGENRWPAAHVTDVARLYRLALEKAEKGAVYNAVGEEGVRLKDIAEAIGAGLSLPVRALSRDEAGPHFGWLGMLAGEDIPASSALTRQRLDWHPSGPTMLADLAERKF